MTMAAAVLPPFRTIQRHLGEALEQPASGGESDASLEARRLPPADPPRIAGAAPLELPVIATRPVAGTPEPGFAAFLDGIQISRVATHVEAMPIVHGSIGAVIRDRHDRRLATWRHEIEGRLYAPRGFLPAAANRALDSAAVEVADTTPRKSDGSVDESARHPLALSDTAVNAVQSHRESLEVRLAEAWIESRDEPLYIDGGISGSARLATSDFAIGIVKSHRTLYGDAAAVRAILGLRAGERSTVFAVTPPTGWRSPVASWYLRLREGPDPLFGLVRVETRMPEEKERPALPLRADQISRWILAEASPLSLPDGRWDTMAYGIRDCEQFLKAILR
jgi:hypothetical protein